MPVIWAAKSTAPYYGGFLSVANMWQKADSLWHSVRIELQQICMILEPFLHANPTEQHPTEQKGAPQKWQ